MDCLRDRVPYGSTDGLCIASFSSGVMMTHGVTQVVHKYVSECFLFLGCRMFTESTARLDIICDIASYRINDLHRPTQLAW